ncbi:MAG: hypothetical protein ACKO01_13305 [Erythrobacter sp.]
MADSATAPVRAPSPQWRKLFLEKLASTSSVAAAARAARVSQARAYRTRRAEPDFAQAWRAAIAEGYLNLELEVIRRLREGDLKTENGDKFDFANAIRLIAAHRDSAGRGGQSEGRNVSIAEVQASIERKIEEVQRRVARQRAAQGKEA